MGLVTQQKYICSCHNKEFKHRKSLNCHLWHMRNKEKDLNYQKKYNKEHCNKKRAYDAQYYKDNRDNHLENRKRWGETHKEKVANYMANWNDINFEKVLSYKKENKDRLSQIRRKYYNTPRGKMVRKAGRQTRRSLEARFSRLTVDTIQQVYERNINQYKVLTCELCFKKIRFGEDSIDHKIPLCRYAEFPNVDLNALSNLEVAHLLCNQKKIHLTLNEWFQKYPKLLENKEYLQCC